MWILGNAVDILLYIWNSLPIIELLLLLFLFLIDFFPFFIVFPCGYGKDVLYLSSLFFDSCQYFCGKVEFGCAINQQHSRAAFFYIVVAVHWLAIRKEKIELSLYL